jgi:hypothetical protein
MGNDTISGVEYHRDLSGTFMPQHLYSWSATPDSLGPISIAIRTPDRLQVVSPVGGRIISRAEGIEVEWSGNGSIAIIISRVESPGARPRPLLHIRPRVNRNRLFIGPKVLDLLPRLGFYVFSFVLFNRNETVVVHRFSGRVLVMASSVHHSVVEVVE